MSETSGVALRGVLLRQGDGVLFSSQGWLQSAIRSLTRSRGESATRVNHFGIITGSTSGAVKLYQDIPIHKALVCEALWHHVEHPLLPNHVGQTVTIYRPQLSPAEDLLEWQINAIVTNQQSYIGDRYPWWKLPFYGIDDKLLGGRVVARRLLFTRRGVCSATGAQSYARGRHWITGKHGSPIAPKAVTPDDIWDAWHEYDTAHWRQIVEQVVIPGPRR